MKVIRLLGHEIRLKVRIQDRRPETPNAGSDKDERQYEHVQESALDQSRGEDKAEEIAARSVSKQPRSTGRTPSKRTQGNANTGLEERTRDELYNIAKQRAIKGRSAMSKQELVSALRKAS